MKNCQKRSCVRKIAKASYYWRCRDESALLHSKASGRAQRKEVGSRLTFPFSKRNKEKRCWSYKKKKEWGLRSNPQAFDCKWLLIWPPAERGGVDPERAAAPQCGYSEEPYLCNLWKRDKEDT